MPTEVLTPTLAEYAHHLWYLQQSLWFELCVLKDYYTSCTIRGYKTELGVLVHLIIRVYWIPPYDSSSVCGSFVIILGIIVFDLYFICLICFMKKSRWVKKGEENCKLF